MQTLLLAAACRLARGRIYTPPWQQHNLATPANRGDGMRRRCLDRTCLLALLWLALVIAHAGPGLAQERRVALVVGNAAYRDVPLRNPVNDARAMAAALRRAGFEVQLHENVDRARFAQIVGLFGERLSEGATGLFYFAGHGLQVQGRNFLIPVDATITSEQRVRLEAIDVEAILDQMQAARTRVSLVVLDACRNNPFERRFRSTAGSGLAQVSAPAGTLIAYATAPGKVAADGEGSNGVYTQELLRALAVPGLKVEEVFKQVRINVMRRTGELQVPWESSSLTGDFVFSGAPAGAAPAVAAPPQRSGEQADEPRTASAVQRPPSLQEVQGRWKGATERWSAELEVSGDAFNGKLTCVNGTVTSVSGKLSPDGRIEGGTPRIARMSARRISGTWPDLEIDVGTGNGICGGGTMTLER